MTICRACRAGDCDRCDDPACGCTHGDDTDMPTGPAAQVRWGLGYIESAYGDA